MIRNHTEVGVWVISQEPDESCLERLGDARRIADSMDLQLGVLLVESGGWSTADHFSLESNELGSTLIRHGADCVLLARRSPTTGHGLGHRSAASDANSLATMSKVETTINAFGSHNVKVVFAGGDPASREWGAMLAAAKGWSFVSPALIVEYRRGRRMVTRTDPSGRKSCQMEIGENETVVVTIRTGVAEPAPVDDRRTGTVQVVPLVGESCKIQSQVLPSDPATGDIRHASRLVAGGRGLGAKQGFELLQEVAGLLDAGIAASRMAVDLGWIDYERQVGQTGKTVKPDLYLACGISGASHHLEGMLESKHVIAINTDPGAPIMKKAHLGLVADLYPVLQKVKQQLGNQEPKR